MVRLSRLGVCVWGVLLTLAALLLLGALIARRRL